MKTYHVTLQVQDILDECINQVALDFRAMRVNDAAAADKYYDDYMLSTDEKDPFVVEFQSVAAELCARFPLSVRACTLTEDRFAADVTIARELPRQIMERRMKDYMKATMLAWWYRLRNRICGESRPSRPRPQGRSCGRCLRRVAPHAGCVISDGAL